MVYGLIDVTNGHLLNTHQASPRALTANPENRQGRKPLRLRLWCPGSAFSTSRPERKQCAAH